MWLREDLAWRLSKVQNLAFDGLAQLGISHAFEVDRVFVGDLHENVESLDGLFAALLPPVDEINPFVEVPTHEVQFKGLAKLSDVQIRVVSRPLRQLDVVDSSLVLHGAEVVMRFIEEHIR